MPPRNSAKNKDVLKELEKTISPVLVVNNSSLKPYVELFEYAPENIYQQPLGSLVGFFEVKEYSEESAYIVNFLTSVLKKEYYINPKRPVTESLDSALHKVNMALSELAKHGNIQWLGKINAAICVLEKNNAHFSVAGDAKIFLYRNQSLSEISEGLASDELEPHPLKTFVNVSSGRMEKNDRLLVTSADIFHILSILEIKKNFQRFEGDKFVQFLKTALSNQMEMIASIVVEMKETVPVKAITKTTASKNEDVQQSINAFSGTTFAKPDSKNTLATDEPDEIENIAQEIDYTDKKTGHIYVQGETIETPEGSNPQIGLYWDMFKEKVSQGSYVTKNELRKRFYLYKKQLAKKKKIRQAEKEKRQAEEAEEKRLRAEQFELERIEREKQLEIERIEHEKQLAIEAEQEKIRLEQEQIRLEQERIENEKIAAIQEIERKKLEKEKIKTIPVQEYTDSEIKEEEFEKIPEPQEIIPAKVAANKKFVSDVKPAQKEVPVEIVDSKKSHEMSFLEKLRQAQLEETEKKSVDNQIAAIKNESVEQLTESNIKFDDSEFGFEAEFEDERQQGKTNPRLEALKSFAKKTHEKTLAVSRKTIQVSKSKLEKIKSSSKDQKIEKTKITNALAPHFSKIGRLYRRLNRQQKTIVAVALVLIFIVPIFIAHYLNQPKPITEAPKETVAPSQAELLANEKNINTLAQVKNVYANPDTIMSLLANDSPIAITKSSVVTLPNGEPQEFPLPQNFGAPIRASFMDDLSLVFVLSDTNKIVSFSPVSNKYTDNKIDLSGISPSSFIGTYLTYLYVLDPKSNQILRFPRADGGFGDKTSWLKDKTDLTDVSDMTIDDNIYAIQNNQILKFFKGQKQSFSLEASKTPVTFSKIFTTPDLTNFYVLDTANSRVVAYSKDGSIVAQYYNEKLKDGTSLSVSEKNKTVYIGTSSELISITLQ